MLTSDFDFDLPARLIAQEPVSRGASRLLRLDDRGAAHDHRIGDLPELLAPGDLLVVNNTRVLAARLRGTRATGGAVEVLLVERRSDALWTCLVRPARRCRPGVKLRFKAGLRATVLDKEEGGTLRLRFSEPPEPLLGQIGHVPLPPYIKRPDTPRDRGRYQTVWASVEGAIAAPTAGLHFDHDLLAALRERGVGMTELTLHVGIGTFKPVTSQRVHEHAMGSERYVLPGAAAEEIGAARGRGGRVVAIGTTVVRALETVAAEHDGDLPAATGSTDLFITPGFDFRAVDLLLTNFHLPRSTLLILVCAFAGRSAVLSAYRHAVREGYRFYSYGDAMLVPRAAD